jgi:hypothetical protein
MTARSKSMSRECHKPVRQHLHAGLLGLRSVCLSTLRYMTMSTYAPTNGRADDQERLNRTMQYASFPDNEWSKLRTGSPGTYKSYTDLIPGEWTHLKIEVNGVKMRLYVNGASQPMLLVNDLKFGDRSGAVALWIGVGTEAYFSNFRLKPKMP